MPVVLHFKYLLCKTWIGHFNLSWEARKLKIDKNEEKPLDRKI